MNYQIARGATPRRWYRFATRTATVACVALVASGAACRDQGPAGDGVRTRWLMTQGGSGEPRPAVDGASVFFATGDARVIARDVRTGAERWSASVSATGGVSATGATLVVSNGTVVVPVLFETVGLDAATGRRLWSYASPPDTVGEGTRRTPGQLASTTPAADSTTAYIPAWGASISAVNLRTGAVRWVWRPGPMASDTATSGIFRSGAEGVTVSGDTVFASVWHFRDRLGVYSSDPVLVALDARTGAELWRVVLPYYTSGVTVTGSPVVAGSLVIMTGSGGRTWAVDRATATAA